MAGVEEPEMWVFAASAGLCLIMVPLSLNWCVKFKAKATGRQPGQPHYRSWLWILIYTFVNLFGWGLIYYLSTVAATGAAEHFDPFELLEVNEFASSRDIKKSYRKLSMIHHPDKGGSLETFQRLEMAYRALTDPVSKENYARYGHPDGRQSFSAGVGLPDFMMDKDNVGPMMVVYMSILIGAPAFCIFGGGLITSAGGSPVKLLADAQKESLVYFAQNMSADNKLEDLLFILAGAPCMLTGIDGDGEETAELSDEDESSAVVAANAVQEVALAGLPNSSPLRKACATFAATEASVTSDNDDDDQRIEPSTALQRLNFSLLVLSCVQRSVAKDGSRVEGTGMANHLAQDMSKSATHRARMELLLGASPQLISAMLRVCSERQWLSAAQKVITLSQALAQGVWPGPAASLESIKEGQKRLLKAEGQTLPSCVVDTNGVEVEDEEHIAVGDTVTCSLGFKRQNKGYPSGSLLLSGNPVAGIGTGAVEESAEVEAVPPVVVGGAFAHALARESALRQVKPWHTGTKIRQPTHSLLARHVNSLSPAALCACARKMHWRPGL